MKLDKHVVDMFTELTKPVDDVKMEKTCYGTISVVDGTRYVKLDGSDLLVPAASTVKTSHGDRVTVLMKNHSLTVTGNLTAPATDGGGGSSGEAGTAATIEVGTVTTGEAGSSASVTNSGTTSAAVFDFVIPRGDKGEKGDTGPQGPQGEKGDTGTWDGTIPDHEHTVSDITDFPTSLPANGGNADTLDGCHANEIAINPNLLINSWFGLGVINQRGQTTYPDASGASNTIDCWKTVDGFALTVNDGFITLSNGDSSWHKYFKQAIEGLKRLSGQTATISAKVRYSTGDYYLVGGKHINPSSDWQIVSHTIIMPDTDELSYIYGGYGVSGSIDIMWIKLELGTIATPFCPPDHATELLKIQAMDGTIPAATVNGRHGGRIPTQNASGNYWNENSTDINDAFIQWDGSTYFKLKTVGRNLTMVDNADTLDGKHGDEFLYANGFAGQIEKLFRDVDTTDDLSSLFSIVPDDANLNDLNPGIYAVTTSAARESLGIPKEGWAAGPSPSSKEAMQTPGGILIKFGRVFGGPNLVMNPGNREFPGNLTDACAFFITNNSVIYHTSTIIKLAVNGGDPTISWKSWTVFLSNNWNYSDQIIISSIKYLSSDATVASGGMYVMYPMQQMWNYPYTSGVAYGPTRTYPLVLNDNRSALVIKNTSSSNLVLPAGRYLIKLN